MTTYLGLDIGTTSLGYCLVERDADRSFGKFIRTGVRKFPEALAGKDKKPKNVTRREMRLRRRQLNHKDIRRKLICELLHGADILPSRRPPLHRKGDNKGTAPNHIYQSRKKALSKPMEVIELGQILRHLAQRTGFAGSPKTSMDGMDSEATKKKSKAALSKQEKDEQEAKAEIKALQAKLNGRTVGEFLAGQPTQRRHHIHQNMIRYEIDKILRVQKQFHPNLLTDEFCKSLQEIMFYRRPIFWRWKSLGKCRYEPDSPLLMKSDWRAQQYNLLQRIGDIRLVSGNQRSLDDEERNILRARMMSSPTIKFDEMRMALKSYWERNGTPLDSKFNFETGADKKEALQGNATEALLRRVFKQSWDNHPHADEIRRDIGWQKWDIHYAKVLKGYREKHKGQRVEIRNYAQIEEAKKAFIESAKLNWGATEDQARALAKASLADGWMRLSEKVIDQMLPEMEAWHRWDEVLKRLYPPQENEGMSELPSHQSALPDARNPVVIRCLNETRKVINNLIRIYGKPDYIRIEVARDIKLVGKKKAAALKKNKDRKKARSDARKWLKANNFAASNWNILKHMLWVESNHRCIYSGCSICAEALFVEGKFQIEHIMPRARSRDDSFNNLLLCREDYNKRKGNRTPYEAFGNSDEWEAMVQRLQRADLPPEKQKRFLRQHYKGIEGGEDRALSQLSDTAYAATLIRDFVAQLYPGRPVEWAVGSPPRVQVLNGQITSQLGRAWGVYREFNKVFIDVGSNRKVTDDHRHHALDAIIVALTTPGLVNHLSSRYNDLSRQGKSYEEVMENLNLRRPWPSFHEDVADTLRKIVVSYRTDGKVNGALTEDTYLGVQTMPNGGKRFVKRIKLESAKAGDIRDILDPRVRDIVWQHVRSFDKSGMMPEKPETTLDGQQKKKVNKAISDAMTAAFAENVDPPRMPRKGVPGAGPPICRVRIEVKQSEHLTVPVHKKAVVLKGDNHHVALYQSEDGRILHQAVSKHDAMRRVQQKQPIVSPKHTEDGEFRLLFSLVKRDMLERTDPSTGEITYWRVDVLGERQVKLCHHTDASEQTKSQPNYGSLIKNGFKKVAVDPVGRVRAAK